MSCCKKIPPSGLSYEEPDLFDRSQWCPVGQVSLLYTLYRIGMAVIFVGGISAHMVNSELGAKWFIYMTDQGILLLTVHYVFDAVLVTSRWVWEKRNTDTDTKYHRNDSINFAYKISWALGTCFFTIALWITIIYWSVLHKYVVENNLMKNEAAKALNVFLHLINSVSCLIDIFISGRPWRVMHFYFAIIFGLYYTFFSLIYWKAGGVGICRPQLPGAPPDCDSYIYPILDWGGNPGLAVGMIFGGCLVIPLLHFCWIGLATLRLKIFDWSSSSSETSDGRSTHLHQNLLTNRRP